MFQPQWHRDQNHKWKKIGVQTKQKPPLDRWKTMGFYFPEGYLEIWVDMNHKKTPVRLLDTKGRIQYQYWANAIQKQRIQHWKHLQLISPFFESHLLPQLKYINSKTWEREDVIRLMIQCSLDCGIRSGHPKYRDENQSYGICTLETRHVRAYPSWKNPEQIRIHFPGKKQVLNECNCIINQALLRYGVWRREQKTQTNAFWMDSNQKTIQPSDLNEWLQTNVHPTMRMKDLRTWLIHRHSLEILSKIPQTERETEKQLKQSWKRAIIDIAEQTHHTPKICESSYLCPSVRYAWMNQKRPFHKVNFPAVKTYSKWICYLWKMKYF